MTTPLGDRPLAASLAADPFTSVAVHYGMLLGVPDFELLMANPRGKLRLHNAWLHGAGVVWGYGVSVDADSREVRVEPGLAYDLLGRELALTMRACLDLGAWFDDHEDELTVTDITGGKQFDAHLVVRATPCLARPVPAMGSSCEGGAGGTAFSRVQETVQLLLLPGPAPAPAAPSFPSLRRLFAFGDTGVAGDRERIGALSEPDREAAWLSAFRRLAAKEVAALLPPGLQTGPPGASGRSLLFPGDEPADVLLADLPGLRLLDQPDGTRKANARTVDIGVRTAHVPTTVLAEMLAELLTQGGGEGAAADAGGPRVASWERTNATVTVTLTADVIEGTLADGLTLHLMDGAAANPSWSPAAVANSAAHPAQAGPPRQPPTITFDLPAEPTGNEVFRAVLRGTGPTPVAGLVDGFPVPLAGTVGGPSGSAESGRDVVLMIKEATP